MKENPRIHKRQSSRLRAATGPTKSSTGICRLRFYEGMQSSSISNLGSPFSTGDCVSVRDRRLRHTSEPGARLVYFCPDAPKVGEIVRRFTGHRKSHRPNMTVAVIAR